MGLDMYAFSTMHKPNMDFGFHSNNDDIEFHYWRKHPNLHGWMENLYRQKGGEESFNTICLLLTIEDIKRLEQDIRNNKLPTTSGFFFGETDGSEFDDDLQFIKDAKELINAGKSVYYYSWW
ncbi:phosphoglycerate kinase [Bartonella sp. LJL80]